MRDQEIICVLGMHRSGTSLLTKILNLTGVDLGRHTLLTTEPFADNPKGYWEHSGLTGISDAIIKRYGGTWDQPPVLPQRWETDVRLDDLRHRALQLIEEEFSQTSMWGWKDPRTCLTLPFWQQLLPRMRYIICLRNPVDVAASLRRRDGFADEKSFRLWLTYVTTSLNQTQAKPRLLIMYEDLMNNCLNELGRLAKFLGTSESDELGKAVQEFVDPQLHHHRSPIQTKEPVSDVEQYARTLYLTLRVSEEFA